MHSPPKKEASDAYASDGSHLKVDANYWQAVADRDKTMLCNLTFFEEVAADTHQFRFLNEDLRIHLARRSLLRQNSDGDWIESKDPLLTLATVMYLKNIDAVYPLGRDIVGAKELKEGHFFTGPHEFRVQPVLKRFENDLDGFRTTAAHLKGEALEMADAAFRLLPFPRVPLYFLLWRGDEEFSPRLQILFDRSIESCLAADAIWALVNRTAMAFYKQ